MKRFEENDVKGTRGVGSTRRESAADEDDDDSAVGDGGEEQEETGSFVASSEGREGGGERGEEAGDSRGRQGTRSSDEADGIMAKMRGRGREQANKYNARNMKQAQSEAEKTSSETDS